MVARTHEAAAGSRELCILYAKIGRASSLGCTPVLFLYFIFGRKTMKKRIISLILVLMLVLSIVPVTALADGEGAVTVSFTAQAEGEFLFAPQINVSVKADLAESYGYADSVENGVSALDVLVRAHELLYGEKFTAETANDYLAISTGDWGAWVSIMFGDTSGSSGFWVNGGYPNVDGMGTTVMTQAVVDGDFVEFFLYQDGTAWSDVYSWIEAADSAEAGGEISVTVKGVAAMNGYSYADTAALRAAGAPIANAALCWVNTETGTLTETGAVTDENGTATVTAPAAAGTYYLSAKAGSDAEAPVILTCNKITVTEKEDNTTPPDDDQKNETENPYDDIDSSWAKEAILYVTEKGLMNGTGSSFEPNGTLNRAMLATILYRLADSPEITGENPFTDVKADSWYGSAVIWASETGIVTGNGDGTFSPLSSITREQIATMLYRYVTYKGEDTANSGSLDAFEDAASVSSWAVEAMQWANANGLVTGRTDTTLVPGGNATRAECATILKRFIG
jgi:hypothetical protein